ncbi:FBP domain-containing protein [Nocardioides ferulae]|uniref:FBP domain-containing protein n=1 Tax=Nocardioides ferulae TaxID=2340821 RepID=UPI000EB4407C|nr:FBP domain-containing protein [Nocardioides ferulae]
MRPLTQREIRASFVNCSKGEASRMHIPHDLDSRPWDELDYLGWRDPQAPARGYLVADLDGQVQGITLRAPQSTVGATRRSMCSLCMTMRSGGVSLMVAPRAGRRGQQGNTVGTYICSDLQCSLSIRGKRPVDGASIPETLSTEERAARLLTHVEEFLARVRAPR